MTKKFKPGDRVASAIRGYYYGLPGTVKSAGAIRLGKDVYCVVDLDIGRQITVSADNLDRLPDDPRARDLE